MATIKITDELGFQVDANVAPSSALLKYFKALPTLVVQHANLSQVGGATLDEPAVRSLKTGLGFRDKVDLGSGAPEVSIQAGVHGSFALISRSPGSSALFSPDPYGDDIEIPEGTCFVGVKIEGSTGADVSSRSGSLTFGVNPSASLEFANYRNFALHAGTTLTGAIGEVIGGFIIPAHADDLASIPSQTVVTVTGKGSLQLSVTADLLATTNPLLTAALPGPIPTPSIKAGGSVRVGASYEIAGEYQVRAEALGDGIVRLGWFRSKSTQFTVMVNASGGIGAGFGDTDLFGTVLKAISSNPAADRSELVNAGAGDAQIKAIQSAVAAAVQRKLELAVSTEISALREGDAAFLYDINPAALTDQSRGALDRALASDLSDLHATTPLPGITCVHSIWTHIRQESLTLKVNLLGIYNFISISKLVRAGTVLFEPVTGALVMSDEETSTRIRAGQVNFGADPDKLRRVLAETFLITAAYKGTVKTAGPISLSCSHTFFSLQDRAQRDTMQKFLQAGAALGLLSGDDSRLPERISDFGRSMIHVETNYNDDLTAHLFLDGSGRPFPRAVYEQAGREAVQLLIREDAEDAIRRRPAIDDDLWATMKDRGQPHFRELFPTIPPPLLGAILADYSAIVWWADSMTGAARLLASVKEFLNAHPKVSPNDSGFSKLRRQLADHLADVTKKTAEEFGQPWGLVAMNQVARRRAGASIIITGPKLVRVRSKALAAGM